MRTTPPVSFVAVFAVVIVATAWAATYALLNPLPTIPILAQANAMLAWAGGMFIVGGALFWLTRR